MRTKLLTLVSALAIVSVLGHYFAKPLLAQARAALIQNVDEPGRNPFTVVIQTTFNPSFTVPAGQRYVIQHFSGFCFDDLPPAAQTRAVDVQNSSSYLSQASVFNGETTPYYQLYRFYANPTLYVDAGTTINFAPDDHGADTKCAVTVSGYSITLP
jgi:hypothetical protein